MSRIGKLPVLIPDKVKVSVLNGTVKVEGPKGKVEKTFDTSVIGIAVEDTKVVVKPKGESRFAKAMHGTVRSTINGMVVGVTKGYEKNLIINGVGFKAAVKGQALDLALGYSHDILQPIPAGVKVTVADGTKVNISGCDKQAVGEFAAQCAKHYPVEPYKAKGVTIEGQHVRRKEGKKAG